MHADATALIGLDWGTTSLRAYRIGRQGTILEWRAGESGILKVPDGDFAAALMATIGDWLALTPRCPVLASGMIGSRQGWREVPYLSCPAGLAEIAGRLAEIAAGDDTTVRLVPGLRQPADHGGFPDVMRGEETQILGALPAGDRDQACFVLPGTHSKWALVEAGRIMRFSTYMTGEIYEVLWRHSILGRLMADGEHDGRSFARGVTQARRSAPSPPGRLLHDMFSARTLGLFGDVPAAGLASYLSGLLIGAEITAALAEAPAAVPITILGGAGLSQLYREALTALDIEAAIGDPDVAALGLYAIAGAAGLIGERRNA